MTKTKQPFPYAPPFKIWGLPNGIIVDGSREFPRRAFVEATFQAACKKLIAEIPQPNPRSLPEDDR
jgi:hypothetical protein